MDLETIGLVGIGAIGEQFAESLETAGYETVAYDTKSERIDVAVEHGAARAQSPTAVAEAADVVVLAVPGSAEVEALVETESFLAALAGGLLVDATTTRPETGVVAAERCADVNVTYVAAPLTRGAPREGTLMMVGAAADDYERATPLLDDLCTAHRRIGPVGDGRRFKLALQMRYALRTALDAEVTTFAREAGVDPAILNDFLEMDVSERYLEAGADYATDNPGLGGLGIWHKDLGYALEVARENDVPTPLTNAGHELYKAGRRAAGPTENAPEAVQYYWERLCADSDR
ncbi:NAD(P)-binding domain-containing protein [Halobacteria archaeon AArc-m2/3/4]|uniref:NAD(P)-binding domain-containing protein n=1 Tax=Natronoglomus mannanivorans TaxID=2979990 RepID=A0ABT2QL45_9EURY|nr:NAD(P)-binding domain-containing protein [Halobacteria archaeon AArc-m2/3/4]